MRQHKKSSKLFAKFALMREAVNQVELNSKQDTMKLSSKQIDYVLNKLQHEDCPALIKLNNMIELFSCVQRMANLKIDKPVISSASIDKALSMIKEANKIIMDGKTPYKLFESLVMAQRKLMQVCEIFSMPIFVRLLTDANNYYRDRTVHDAYLLYLECRYTPITTFMDNYTKFIAVLNVVLKEAKSQNDVESIKEIEGIFLEEGEVVSKLQPLNLKETNVPAEQKNKKRPASIFSEATSQSNKRLKLSATSEIQHVPVRAAFEKYKNDKAEFQCYIKALETCNQGPKLLHLLLDNGGKESLKGQLYNAFINKVSWDVLNIYLSKVELLCGDQAFKDHLREKSQQGFNSLHILWNISADNIDFVENFCNYLKFKLGDDAYNEMLNEKTNEGATPFKLCDRKRNKAVMNYLKVESKPSVNNRYGMYTNNTGMPTSCPDNLFPMGKIGGAE